ncbi:MAG TPA: DUF2231 domain-containing protein [Thermoanaerobaculia bacterium]|nr:DUF2231 domain-containing protein [Thermoanaerobaculia bacterium]
MQSKARLLGHPIHQMLIVFPLGLLTTSLIFDVIGGISHHGIWNFIAFYMIGAGIFGGVVAGAFGLVDWVVIPRRTRAKLVGLQHAIANVVALVIFAASWVMRLDAPHIPGRMAILVSAVGVAVAGLGGWLGGELVNRFGVGVHEGAHLNSPGSLSGRPASDDAGPGPA